MTEREMDELVALEREPERGAQCIKGPCRLGPWDLSDRDPLIATRKCQKCGRVAITAKLE